MRLLLDAHGNTLADLKSILERVDEDLASMAERSATSINTTSGGVSSGFHFEVDTDEAITAESYSDALEAWRVAQQAKS